MKEVLKRGKDPGKIKGAAQLKRAKTYKLRAAQIPSSKEPEELGKVGYRKSAPSAEDEQMGGNRTVGVGERGRFNQRLLVSVRAGNPT